MVRPEDLKTGDILLFEEFPNSSCFQTFTGCIKKCTESRYSHCAIVIKNRLNLPKNEVWVWESSYHSAPPTVIDPKDNKKNKFGVQNTPLSYYTKQYPGRVNIYVRRRSGDSKICKYRLSGIRSVVHGKPYDINPCDWLMAKFRCGPRKTVERFWCSALVAYILYRLEDIENCDWSEVRASDLSSTALNSPIRWKTQYGEDEPLKLQESV